MAAGCEPARDAEAGVERHTITSTGHQYEVAIPDSYDGTTPAPLLLSLHGFTSTIEQQNELTQFPTLATERGYVVVTPQALDADVPVNGGTRAPFWNVTSAFVVPEGQPTMEAGDDVGFLFALLDQLERDLCIDDERVYVSGLSNGASMTMILICTDDQRFAAAAPVAGVNLAIKCAAERATPLLAHHGDADPLVPFTGGSMFGYDLGLPTVEARMVEWAALGGCDAEPNPDERVGDVTHRAWRCPEATGVELYTIAGGGHTWHPGATKRILDFFDSRSLGQN